MNYYDILKIPQTATKDQIKDSYKKLAKQYHPDLYVGDKDFAEKKIKEINEAYDILSNPEKKAEYDEYLNPTPHEYEQTHTYNPSYTQKNYSYTTTAQTNNPNKQDPSFDSTQYIYNKINKLDSKRQIQLFLLILIVIILLVLINLIQLQNYLINSSNSDSYNYTDYEYDNYDEYKRKYLENSTDFESYDDIINNILNQYEQYEKDYQSNIIQ